APPTAPTLTAQEGTSLCRDEKSPGGASAGRCNAGQGGADRAHPRSLRGLDLLVFPLDRLALFLGSRLWLTLGTGSVAARRAIAAAFASAARLVVARPDPLQHIGELLLGRVDDPGVVPLPRPADRLSASLYLLAIVPP